MGAVTREMVKNETSIHRRHVDIHWDQVIMERFNCTLAERLFGYQYAVEMRLPDDQRSTEWVKRLPAVVFASNDKVTCMIGENSQKPSKTRPSRPNPLHLILGLLG